MSGRGWRREGSGGAYRGQPRPTSPDPEYTRRVTPSRGVYCEPSRCRHEKGPLTVEAFIGPDMNAGGLTAPATGHGRQYRDATKKSGSGALAVGGRVGILFRLKDNAVVELGEWQFDVDLWKGENGVGDQDFVCPSLA